MHSYAISEASTSLAMLIEQAKRGERVMLTDAGRAVAEIVASPEFNKKQTIEAISAIKALRTGSIDEEPFRRMRVQGRYE
ncbi:hypothetical protein LJR289_005846 [Pseudoduganella sp. LjRoot289]|uniref:type II toxin-antitoxin system Phd/YefM family antitoxin n=1 Tax=Pseudoduganella sp. LjRoot289 TaxID=3342314 RepID=UPI003ECF2482